MWLLIVLLAVVVGGVLIYNSLVKLREQLEGAWSDIDVQLKRRYDLVPNVVETVKGYANHERETFDAVVEARTRAMSAQGPGDRAQAEGMLTGALKSLFALAEAYPQLRASENFTRLQATLADLEDHIQNARRYYNAVVRDYNTRTEVIPDAVIARAFAFRPREFFSLSDPAQAGAPPVDLPR
jgi:LemA protein